MRIQSTGVSVCMHIYIESHIIVDANEFEISFFFIHDLIQRLKFTNIVTFLIVKFLAINLNVQINLSLVFKQFYHVLLKLLHSL